MAWIDLQKALLSTKDGEKSSGGIKLKFAPKQQEFQKRQTELQAKQEQYRKTENTISEEAKATLARDIDAMTKNLQRDTDDARQDVDQEQQRVLNELGQKMMQVLQKYSSDKQLTMVFDVSGQPNNILFASNTIDITCATSLRCTDAAAPVTLSVASATSPPQVRHRKPAAPKPAAPATATPAPK